MFQLRTSPPLRASGSYERERHREEEPEASARTAARGDRWEIPEADVGPRRPAAAAATANAARAGTVTVAVAVAQLTRRAAIVSTYPPRAYGISTFAADLRRTLLGVAGLEGADIVAVVNEPSRPQRRGLLSVNGPAVRGDYVRAARTLGRLDVDVVLLQHEYGTFGGLYGEYPLRACSP